MNLKQRLACAPMIADRRIGMAGVAFAVFCAAAALLWSGYSQGTRLYILVQAGWVAACSAWIWWADNYREREATPGDNSE